jgi:hypothetical protein
LGSYLSAALRVPPLGTDALEWIQRTRDREEADHREWESVIRGTDFDAPRG